jgi:putative ABC transport system permease protein
MRDVGPILSAMRRNKTGPLIVVLQIALTLAIISNIVGIVTERTALITRPTGVQENQVFALGYRLTSGEGTPSTLVADLETIRATPGVIDAVAVNGYPLRGTGWGDGISKEPGRRSIHQQSAQAAVYAMDEHGIGTLGLKLASGRNFSPQESIEGNFIEPPLPGVAIVSKMLANQLFPHGDILGKTIYLTTDSSRQVVVVGVVERLQSFDAAATVDEHASENSIILPIHSAGQGGLFLVRAQPGLLDSTMHQVQQRLTAVNPSRVFGRLRPFTEIRRTAYEKDRAMAIALSIVCAILVLVTALGIVGVTTLWVAKRRKQIGVRRALGATRCAIVSHFLTENALLCCAGIGLGLFAAHSISVWLWVHYGSDRRGAAELLICAFVVLSLGQCAAVIPAFRAARISPTEAFRSL